MITVTAHRSDLAADLDDVITDAADTGSTLDQYVALTRVKRELDAALRTLRGRLDTRQTELLDEFAEEGVSSKRHAATGASVHITRKIWARPAEDVTKDQAADKLEAAGLGDFVERGFNTHSLSAYFREQAKDQAAETGTHADLADLLPEQLKGVIALTEDHALGVSTKRS